jgi:L-ascorbate metabolism protein UlaG (beta-lactamase superfamily)
LLQLPPDSNVLVWFENSSYFIQLGGKRILVDPVFDRQRFTRSGHVKAFKEPTFILLLNFRQ